MFLIIVPLLAFIVVLLHFIIEFSDAGAGILFGIAVCLIAFIIATFIWAYVSYNYTIDYPERINSIVDEKVKLIALEDNQGIEGRAFLYSSYMKEELTYTYLYEHSTGAITSNSIKAKNCFIRYIEENETPYITYWHTEAKNKFVNWFFKPQNNYYTIYLPRGSVIENSYNIDLR